MNSEPQGEAADIILPPRAVEAVAVQQPADGRSPLSRANRLSKESWGLVLRRTVADFALQGLYDRGATMTFYTLLTFAPAVLAAYSIATLLFSSRREQVTELIGVLVDAYVPDNLSEQAINVLGLIIGTSAQGTVALVVSVLISLFSASGYVRAFSRAANEVYGRVEGRGIVRTWALMWFLTIVLVCGAVALLFANLLRDTVINRAIKPIARPLHLEGVVDFLLDIILPVWDWLRFPLTVLLVLVLIAVLYHFAPNVRADRFRWISLGSVLALVVMVAVWAIFALYVQLFAAVSAYGALGMALALIMAVWVMNTALIVGVKVDAEILRAKELQLGLHSERHIQAPPRSDAATAKKAERQKDLEERSARVRRSAPRKAPQEVPRKAPQEAPRKAPRLRRAAGR